MERAGAPISDPLVPIESWLLYCGLQRCPRARCFGALVPDGMLHQNKTFCGSEWDRPHRAFSPVITKNFASIRTAFRIPLLRSSAHFSPPHLLVRVTAVQPFPTIGRRTVATGKMMAGGTAPPDLEADHYGRGTKHRTGQATSRTADTDIQVQVPAPQAHLKPLARTFEATAPICHLTSDWPSDRSRVYVECPACNWLCNGPTDYKEHLRGGMHAQKMQQLKQDDVETISDDEGDPFIGPSTESGVEHVSDLQGWERPATLEVHVAATKRRKRRARAATREAKAMASQVSHSLVGGGGLTGG